jgi:hypothetical protein
VIKLIRQAMLFGKAIDGDGEPVRDANIQCLRRACAAGQRLDDCFAGRKLKKS